jgi:hypothetical protein
MAYSQISIRLGGLVVEIGTEATYPDMVSDLTNRCLTTFKDAMDKAEEQALMYQTCALLHLSIQMMMRISPTKPGIAR